MYGNKLSRRSMLAMMAATAISPNFTNSATAGEETLTTLNNSVATMPERTVSTDLGVPQQSNEKLAWLLDSKFGMFIHWGLYAGPAQGEWYQENQGILPEDYRRYAFQVSRDQSFSADKYDPGQWADLAKDAGMRWMCLTTRHHEGYSLFDNPHHNSFTSLQTHKRDFVAEYVKAVRSRNLKVGLYFSPIDWRYPSYYDVTGTDCKPNKFGYITEPTHKENARVWKTENYAAVKKLMTSYGKIDHVFWDGGWIAQEGSDADGNFFHEPGKYLDPSNPWQIDKEYLDYDESGRPLGIMGMVRKYQPDLVCNGRYGWLGDFNDNEGGQPTTGQFNTIQITEKCITIQNGPWGYSRECDLNNHIKSRDEIICFLANCVVRNMFLLLNVSPDRSGQIPVNQINVLRDVGKWLARVGEAVYSTRCGPWQPVDHQYGYCYKGNTLYTHVFADYVGDEFTIPAIGSLVPVKAYDVFSKTQFSFSLQTDRTILISGFDRTANPVDTIIAVVFDKDVMSYAV